MKKQFWENPYQTSLCSTVKGLSGSKVLLQETIIFSFSGGQESDHAVINGLPVLDSEMVGNLIYYTLAEGHGLVVGSSVFMEINWQRRYRLMRLHFAAELVLELLTRKLPLEKIGAHIAETKARIDFCYGQNIAPVLPDILRDYNKLIVRNHPIHTGFSDVETQRRYWKIEGFNKVPCGGTHVKSTAEVGCVTLKRVNIGGGKERVEIRLINA